MSALLASPQTKCLIFGWGLFMTNIASSKLSNKLGSGDFRREDEDKIDVINIAVSGNLKYVGILYVSKEPRIYPSSRRPIK